MGAGPSDSSFDLAVIGSGPGGYAAALAGARRGARVALIERDRWGGVCLNVGCIPTKSLIAVAHLLGRIERAKEFGIAVDGYRLDFDAVRGRTDRIVSGLRRGLTDLLKLDGVTLIPGAARFEDPHRLLITHEGRTQTLIAERAIIATGASPAAGSWAFDERRILSYRGLLSYPQLPKALLIIGGGVIGCEFAACFARFGSQVTVVEQLPQLLPAEDPEAVRWVARRLQSLGVAVKPGATVETLATGGDGVHARLSDGAVVEAECCLVAIGLRPNVQGLGLAEAGVEAGRGIQVDAFLKTSQSHIAAIGDCLEGHGLAHWASAEGQVAVRNLFGGSQEALDRALVPRCAFTDPEVASVGVRTDGGGAWKTARFSLGALGRSHCDGDVEGFVKLAIDPGTDHIKGATIVGANASNLLHGVVLAMTHGITARRLAETITMHPTAMEAVTEAAAHVYGDSLCASGRGRSRQAA